jgi:hypothetical protein
LLHFSKALAEIKTEGKRRQGRRRKQLHGDVKERKMYWNLKEEALDRTVWRNRFGRGYGPIAKQITHYRGAFSFKQNFITEKNLDGE